MQGEYAHFSALCSTSGSYNDCTLSKDTSKKKKTEGKKKTLAGDMDQVETSELPVQSEGTMLHLKNGVLDHPHGNVSAAD